MNNSDSLGAEDRTNGDSSQAMIRSEMGQIKEFAQQRKAQKNDRKLFRP